MICVPGSVRKFFSSFVQVLLALKERDPEEIKASAREWAKRDKKKDADGEGPGAVDKRGKKGKGGGKVDGGKEEEEGKDEEMGKEEEEEEEDKAEKGERDEDKMEEEEENDGEDEDEGDDDQDDLWQAVHSLSPQWQPMRSLRSPLTNSRHEEGAGGAAGMDGEEEGGIWKLEVKAGVKVFFGNLSCYVFFRLYQKLYQRLLNAKELAHAVQQDQEAEKSGRDEGADGSVGGSQAATGAWAGAMDDANAGAEGKAPGAGAESSVYDKFMQMLYDLVEGHIDTSKFEDDCRMLLGTNSYELYTLEKVVEKVLLQVQHLTSETSQQTGSRLLALHEYEHLRARTGSLDELEAPHLAEYMRNAACLAGEEGCFGFYFDKATQVLSIVLHDVQDSGKAGLRKERRREGWYVALYISLDDVTFRYLPLLIGTEPSRFADFVKADKDLPEGAKLPFLSRNVASAGAAADGASAPQDVSRWVSLVCAAGESLSNISTCGRGGSERRRRGWRRGSWFRASSRCGVLRRREIQCKGQIVSLLARIRPTCSSVCRAVALRRATLPTRALGLPKP
jgi:hypothetical protein